ncbi:MAG: TlpA disulfide reductase family protein [Alistipes sp.]
MTKRFGGNLQTLPEGTIIYVDSALNRVYYTPRNIGQDTLIVSAPFGYAEIIHRNQAVESIYYLLKAGDTVLFTYGANLRPQIRSLSLKHNTTLYNIPYDDPRALQSVGYSTRSILNNSYYKMADEALNRPKRKYPSEIIAFCNQYYIDLDSLRPIYEKYRQHFQIQLDSLEASGALPKIYAAYYRQQHIDSLPAACLPVSDSLMHYISHYNRAIAWQYQVAPNNAKSPQRFDIIASDTILSPIVKKAILHDIMSSIEAGDYWRAYPPEIVLKYRGKYQQITGDTTFRISIVNKENLVQNGYSTDLTLKDLEGNQCAYGDILDQYKGKVIYVDMWASWCGPCRAGMPDAKNLREEYKGKDVVFIYLAINDADDAWRGAVRSCQTDYLGENYRVLNAGESQFLKEIKHTRIPHLLLYDKSGHLVNENAPRPESQEIRAALNRYL